MPEQRGRSERRAGCPERTAPDAVPARSDRILGGADPCLYSRGAGARAQDARGGKAAQPPAARAKRAKSGGGASRRQPPGQARSAEGM